MCLERRAASVFSIWISMKEPPPSCQSLGGFIAAFVPVVNPFQNNSRSSLVFRIQGCYTTKMKRTILISLAILAIGWSGVTLAQCPLAHPLFKIERSKNKHIVQYDICVSENGDVPDPKPVRAYWILENGERHDLNFI